MIKVLIAEDSPTLRELLRHILGSDPAIRVVGSVSNGEEAIEAAHRLRPDVVTMDVHMPRMDGFEATRRIMMTEPVPIVIVSSTLSDQVAATFRAMEAGALAFVSRPPGPEHTDHAAASTELVETVKLMAEIKVVRRWAKPGRPKAARGGNDTGIKIAPAEVRLVAIGASTGGPVVLQSILSGLPKGMPAPVLIVQHIAPGFVQGLAEWLAQSCDLPAHVAGDGERALPGHVYLAPDGIHMGIDKNCRIGLSNGAAEDGLCPSVSHLFRSVAEAFGPNAVGVLLTGMGRDGAEELKAMKDKGAITIAQDRDSSVVHGMPGVAIALGGATHVLPREKIAAALVALVNHGKGISRN